MVERLADDGRWYVLDMVAEAQPGTPLVDVVEYGPTLPSAGEPVSAPDEPRGDDLVS
jgi:hypothetical protein